MSHNQLLRRVLLPCHIQHHHRIDTAAHRQNILFIACLHTSSITQGGGQIAVKPQTIFHKYRVLPNGIFTLIALVSSVLAA